MTQRSLREGKLACILRAQRLATPVCVVALLLLLSAPVAELSAHGRAEDAVLHEAAGVAVALAATAAYLTVAPYPLATTDMILMPSLAVAGAFVAGSAKELADLRGSGTAELRDIIHTSIGGAAGGLIATASVGVFCAAHHPQPELNVGMALMAFATGASLAVTANRAAAPPLPRRAKTPTYAP